MSAGAPHPGRRAAPPAIEGYKLSEVLGRGASGVVYRARQLSMDRVVALKVLHASTMSSTRAVQRLQREARTAARLSHPNIVSAIDMGHVAATWWFAMELVEGKSLAEQLEHGGRLSERAALDLFIPLCDALQHAAERGVVHRDIKPANILVESSGRPRLVDLGLARVEEDPMLTRTGATLGTPHYISPEQARDPSVTDVRSDLWSLGATLFHVVTGQPPFSGTSAAEILSSVLYEPIPDPAELRPELSSGLCLVLRKCLSRRIDGRYFTADELKRDLELVRRRKAPSVKRRQLEPLESDRRRNARVRGALAFAGVAFAVGGLFAWAPWEGGVAEDTTDEVADGSWAPLVELQRDLDEGRVDLEQAHARLTELGQLVPPHQLDAWEALRVDWYGRFEEALFVLKRGGESSIDEWIAARDFAAADRYIEVGAREELAAATGFSVLTLLDRARLEYEQWLAAQRDEVDRARRLAESQVVSALETYRDERLAPRVAAARARGDWAEVLSALEAPLDQHFATARADLRGLGEARVRELGREFIAANREQAAASRNEFWKLDEELRREVNDRARSASVRLENRDVIAATDDFHDEAESFLAERGLVRGALPADLESRAFEALDRRTAELRDLEERLLERDAVESFEGLERRADPMLQRREYAAVRELWRGRIDAPEMAPVQAEIELRVREAEVLAAHLERVAATLREKSGERIELFVERVAYDGELFVVGDPIERGFELKLPTGRTTRFRLAGPRDGPGGPRLDPAALDALAGDARDDDDRLARALLAYHEERYDRADRELQELEQGEESLLAFELRLRLDDARGAAADELEARRVEAEREYASILDASGRGGDRGVLVRRIDKLLRLHSELSGGALDTTQSERLRELRRDLRKGFEPSAREDFVRVFRPDEVVFPSFGRVRMSWSFAGATTGEWDRGTWHHDGAPGWIGAPLPDDGEMVRRAAPTLLLRDPFVVDQGVVVFDVRFAQPESTPPDLFVVSALGFHAAFVGRRVGEPARCLVDTTGLEDVVARVRTEGVAFEGWREGGEHTLRLRLNPARGTVEVRLDDARVTSAERRSPVGGPRSSSLSVRAREPVRLLEATITGDRR